MRFLVLSGGGSGEQTRIVDKLFADQLDKNKPLLYIPIAINTDTHPYSDCLVWLKKNFTPLGVNNYLVWDEKTIYTYKKHRVSDFAGIYIGGGNTPYLLKTLKDNGFWNFLKRAMNKIPIYGGSAGAILFGKTIYPSLIDDENFVDLKDFSAMNIINEHDISCHYTDSKEKITKEFNASSPKLIALPEETGLLIADTEMLIVGSKSAFHFIDGKKKELKVGLKVQL